MLGIFIGDHDMTDFNKIKDYYRYFDEKNRLVNSGSGRLEYMISMEILDFNHPNQVDSGNLKQVFQSGKFNNLLDVGFQEGYYPTLEEIDELFGGKRIL